MHNHRLKQMLPQENKPYSFPKTWRIVIIFFVLLLLTLNSFTKLRPIWQLVTAGATANRPTVDLHVLLTGIDCYRESGFKADETAIKEAVLKADGVLFNYPSMWFCLARVPGISTKNITLLAAGLYLLFGITLYFLFKNDSGLAKFLVVLTVLSPSILLLCERGNNDIAIFCAVSWMGLLLIGNSLRGELAATGLLLTASFLKLFPIFAIAAVIIKTSRRRLILFSICLAIFCTSVVALHSDISRVRKTTPEPTHNSYGAKVMIYEILGNVEIHRHANNLERFQQKLEARNDYPQLVFKLGVMFQILAAVLCSSCALFGLRAQKLIETMAVLTSRQKILFLAGACIYTATFIANNNWSYRLVFLILCIPALLTLARAGTAPSLRFFLWLLLGSVLIVFWMTPIYEPLEYFVLHNTLHWLAVGGLSFVLGAMLRSTLADGILYPATSANS